MQTETYETHRLDELKKERWNKEGLMTRCIIHNILFNSNVEPCWPCWDDCQREVDYEVVGTNEAQNFNNLKFERLKKKHWTISNIAHCMIHDTEFNPDDKFCWKCYNKCLEETK